MWQQILMGLLVLAAGAYVVWTFLPMLSRQRLLDALAGKGLLVDLSRRHRARLSAPGCSNCSAASTPSHLGQRQKQQPDR